MSIGEDPRAVVNLILKCGSELDLQFSNLAVQKLLYFAHSSYLVTNRKPLISGVFEAWEHGPVCRAIYNELKSYGRSKITQPITKKDLFTGEERPIPASSKLSVVSHVYGVTKTLGRLSPSELRNLSHIHNGPWDVVWNKAKTSVTFGNRITDSLILERYRIIPTAIDTKDENFHGFEATPFAGD